MMDVLVRVLARIILVSVGSLFRVFELLRSEVVPLYCLWDDSCAALNDVVLLLCWLNDGFLIPLLTSFIEEVIKKIRPMRSAKVS